MVTFPTNCRNKVIAWNDGALNHPDKSSEALPSNTLPRAREVATVWRQTPRSHRQALLTVPALPHGTHPVPALGTSMTIFHFLIITQRNTAAYLSISYSFIPTFTAFITSRWASLDILLV